MFGDLSFSLIPFGTMNPDPVEDLSNYWKIQCPTVSDWDIVPKDVKDIVKCAK